MDFQQFRNQFPSLRRELHGRPIIYLDGPAGTQVSERVIDAISHYYRTCNANTHGQFAASQESDRIIESARHRVAEFIGAEDGRYISFGQNMTTLNFSLSKALVRSMSPGDEIVITQLDHEANRGPWLNLQEHGIIIQEVQLLPNGTLDYEDFESKINARTKLVCMGYASNIFGTVNNVPLVRQWTREKGILLLVDAVHYAPHLLLDVTDLDCDFLLCSAYKFYGPHVGILYCHPGLLETLPTDRLRTQDSRSPHRIETGTLNHAAIAGVEAAIHTITSLDDHKNMRKKIRAAMEGIRQQENRMARKLYEGLAAIQGITLYGPGFEDGPRAPTVAFTAEGFTAEKMCYELAKRAIYAWDGHFYALRAAEVLGLPEKGWVTRMGVVAYNTEEEIDRTLGVVQSIMHNA